MMIKQKRFLLLAVISIIMLVGCGQSEAAKNVDLLISQLGEITLESEEAIKNAENALSALNEEDVKSLQNAQILTDARKKYDELVEEWEQEQARLLAEEEFNKKVSEVEKAISAIGVVDLYSGSKISNARETYDKADEDVKQAVSNYDVLVAAEADLKKGRVNKVVNLINDIGSTVYLYSWDGIKEARKEYNALNDDEKADVTNLEQLENAEASIKELQEEAMTHVKKEEDKFKGTTTYHPPTWPRYVNDRNHILPFIMTDDKSVVLGAIYTYTGRDWIFYDKVYIVTDNNRYEKEFSYYDVNRKVNNGVVEYAIVEVTEKDRKMFWDISYSENVEVQFMGDGGAHREFTMSNDDKKSISYILATYDYLMR